MFFFKKIFMGKVSKLKYRKKSACLEGKTAKKIFGATLRG